jgi:hypothetical protein
MSVEAPTCELICSCVIVLPCSPDIRRGAAIRRIEQCAARQIKLQHCDDQSIDAPQITRVQLVSAVNVGS